MTESTENCIEKKNTTQSAGADDGLSEYRMAGGTNGGDRQNSTNNQFMVGAGFPSCDFLLTDSGSGTSAPGASNSGDSTAAPRGDAGNTRANYQVENIPGGLKIEQWTDPANGSQTSVMTDGQDGSYHSNTHKDGKTIDATHTDADGWSRQWVNEQGNTVYQQFQYGTNTMTTAVNDGTHVASTQTVTDGPVYIETPNNQRGRR